jgi:hypothetical protein
MPMDGGNSEDALKRIEAALARLEAAAKRPASGATEWEARHQRLRDAVGRSLQQLDELIGSQAEAAE